MKHGAAQRATSHLSHMNLVSFLMPSCEQTKQRLKDLARVPVGGISAGKCLPVRLAGPGRRGGLPLDRYAGRFSTSDLNISLTKAYLNVRYLSVPPSTL